MERRRRKRPDKFFKIMVLAALLLRVCHAQPPDFYDGPANSYYWQGPLGGGMAGYGSAAGDGQGQQNPFTPQDFGGSSSDGFDAFDRQQQQQQLGFQANGDLSFLPRPSSASPLDFHAYGSNGGAYSTVGGDDAAGDDEAAEAADDAEEFTKFPTLIPPQKLAAQGAVGLTEPVMVEDVTEPSQPNWSAQGDGRAIGEIKDVSMMKSVPAPPPRGMMTAGYGGFFPPQSPQQQQQFGGTGAWMGGGAPTNNNNDCFGTASNDCPIETGGGGGGSFLSGDGGAYQFPMPEEGPPMGMGGGMANGNGMMGQPPFGQNNFPNQMGSFGGNGMFPNSPNGFMPPNQFGASGNFNPFMGSGPFGGIGGGANIDAGGDEEDDEQEEFGGVGSFVETAGPPMNYGGQPQGAFGQMGGEGEEQRYAQYLEMINRKYGIGMPGNPAAPNVANAGQINLLPINGGGMANGFGAAGGAGFGLPPWGISPTAGGMPNGQQPQMLGQMRILGQIGPTNGGAGNQQIGHQSQQQTACQLQLFNLNHQNNQQPKVLPPECVNGNGGSAGAGGGQLGSANGASDQHNAGFAGAEKNGGNGQHGSGGAIVGTVHGHGGTGTESHGGGTTKSPSTPRSLNGMESGTIIGGKMEETATTGLVDVEEKANRENALYGSAMLGRLLGDNIAHSLRQHTSALLKNGAGGNRYALSGAAVPFPFGTGPARGVGVDGGPWLPPAPSVSSLLGKQPGKTPPKSQQPKEETDQRPIEAIQRQLLLALLGATTAQQPLPTIVARTTPVPPPMPTTTMASSTTTTTPAAMASAEAVAPVQMSTTSVQALTQQIRRLPAVLYADSRLPSARKLETLLREVYGLPLVTFYVDRMDRPQTVERNLEELTAHRGLPYLFICGTFIGTTEHIQAYHEQRQIPKLVEFVCNGEAQKKEHRNHNQRSTSAISSRQQMDAAPIEGTVKKSVNKGNRKKRLRKNDDKKNGRRRQTKKAIAGGQMKVHRDEPVAAPKQKHVLDVKKSEEGRRVKTKIKLKH